MDYFADYTIVNTFKTFIFYLTIILVYILKYSQKFHTSFYVLKIWLHLKNHMSNKNTTYQFSLNAATSAVFSVGTTGTSTTPLG